MFAGAALAPTAETSRSGEREEEAKPAHRGDEGERLRRPLRDDGSNALPSRGASAQVVPLPERQPTLRRLAPRRPRVSSGAVVPSPKPSPATTRRRASAGVAPPHAFPPRAPLTPPASPTAPPPAPPPPPLAPPPPHVPPLLGSRRHGCVWEPTWPEPPGLPCSGAASRAKASITTAGIFHPLAREAGSRPRLRGAREGSVLEVREHRSSAEAEAPAGIRGLPSRGVSGSSALATARPGRPDHPATPRLRCPSAHRV